MLSTPRAKNQPVSQTHILSTFSTSTQLSAHEVGLFFSKSKRVDCDAILRALAVSTLPAHPSWLLILSECVKRECDVKLAINSAFKTIDTISKEHFDLQLWLGILVGVCDMVPSNSPTGDELSKKLRRVSIGGHTIKAVAELLVNAIAADPAVSLGAMLLVLKTGRICKIDHSVATFYTKACQLASKAGNKYKAMLVKSVFCDVQLFWDNYFANCSPNDEQVCAAFFKHLDRQLSVRQEWVDKLVKDAHCEHVLLVLLKVLTLSAYTVASELPAVALLLAVRCNRYQVIDTRKISTNQWKIILPYVSSKLGCLSLEFKAFFETTELAAPNWKLIKIRALFNFGCTVECYEYATAQPKSAEIGQLAWFIGNQLLKSCSYEHASCFLRLASECSDSDEADIRLERAGLATIRVCPSQAKQLFEQAMQAWNCKEVRLKSDKRIGNIVDKWLQCQKASICIPAELEEFFRKTVVPHMQAANHPRLLGLLEAFKEEDMEMQVTKLFYSHDVGQAQRLLQSCTQSLLRAKIHSAIAHASRFRYAVVDWDALVVACSIEGIDSELLVANALASELQGRPDVAGKLSIDRPVANAAAHQFRTQALNYFSRHELSLAYVNAIQSLRLLKGSAKPSSQNQSLAACIDMLGVLRELANCALRLSDVHACRNYLTNALKLAQDLYSKHYEELLKRELAFVEAVKAGGSVAPIGVFCFRDESDIPAIKCKVQLVKHFPEQKQVDMQLLSQIYQADCAHALPLRTRLVRYFISTCEDWMLVAGLMEMDRLPVYRQTPSEVASLDPNDPAFHKTTGLPFDRWLENVRSSGQLFFDLPNAIFILVDDERLFALNHRVFIVKPIRGSLMKGMQEILEDSKKTLVFGAEALQAAKCQDSADAIPEFKLDAPRKVTHSESSENEDLEMKRRRWWTERRALDRRLCRLLAEIESGWLEPFASAVTLQNRNASLDVERVAALFEGSPQANEMLQALCPAKLVPLEHLAELLRVINDVCKTRVDPVEFRKALLAALSIRESPIVQSTEQEDVFTAKPLGNASHRSQICLLLDRQAQFIPWESIPSLRDIPCVRLPFIPADARRQAWKLGFSHYVLNPSGDLKATQDRLLPRLAQFATGSVNCNPSSHQILDALSSKDLYLYFGHAGGEMYCHPTDIARQSVRAVAWLVGCSSGRLRYWNSPMLDTEGIVLALLKANWYKQPL